MAVLVTAIHLLAPRKVDARAIPRLNPGTRMTA